MYLAAADQRPSTASAGLKQAPSDHHQEALSASRRPATVTGKRRLQIGIQRPSATSVMFYISEETPCFQNNSRGFLLKSYDFPRTVLAPTGFLLVLALMGFLLFAGR